MNALFDYLALAGAIAAAVAVIVAIAYIAARAIEQLTDWAMDVEESTLWR